VILQWLFPGAIEGGHGNDKQENDKQESVGLGTFWSSSPFGFIG
jgi:hypothetical protein